VSLDKNSLRDDIKAAFEAAFAETDPDNRDQAMTNSAQSIADAIDTYVKAAVATVVVPVGSFVVSCGAAPVMNPVPVSVVGDPSGTPAGGLT